MITNLKLTTSRFLWARNAWTPRAFVTATPTLSQSKKDKETIEACENVKEAANAVKEGAKVVKETSEYVKETAASTAENVNKMTEEVGDKAKDLVVDAAKATTEVIRDKVMNKH